MKLPPRKDLRLAKAPATRAENGDYPAEWDLREFAYSSVYFQNPPRWLIARTVWWLTLAVLGICLAVFGCWLLSFLLPTMLDKRQFEEAYMFASIPPFGGLLLYTAMTNLRSLHIWRNASIVPARIEVVHEGVPLPNWVALIGGGGLGLLGTLGVAVIRVFLLASLHVVTVEDGKRVRRTIRVNLNETSAVRGDYLWLAIAPTGGRVVLWDLSLDSLHASRVPLNVKSWMNDALLHAIDEEDSDDQVDTERRQAAEANTRAMKRAGRG